MKHSTAVTMCQLFGGHLPVTETQQEHEELKMDLSDIIFVMQAGVWFGVISTNGNFTWEPTGQDLSHGYVNWLSDPTGSPNPGTMCSSLDNGFVRLDSCESRFYVICEHDRK